MGHRTNRFRHPCNLLLAVLLQLQLSKDIFQPRNTLFFLTGVRSVYIALATETDDRKVHRVRRVTN